MGGKGLKTLKQLREHLFSSLSATVFLLFLAWVLLWGFPIAFEWGVLNATWSGASVKDCRPMGACWAMVHARWDQFMYGFYPLEQRWRVDLALVLLGAGILSFSVLPVRLYSKIIMMIAIILLAVYILYGGLGLPVVSTNKWGGLFLTIVLSFGAIAGAMPIALMLALGRSSSLMIVKGLCICVIEFIRGVPLISILFMASVMLPLFFPQEIVIDKLLRAFIAITLFEAAYLAEVIRGGLNSLPAGQYEAAYALGMGYWQTMILVILPQALRVVIPGMVNSFIALFKDTTLVLMIGLFDFLGIVQSATTDPRWLGTALEGYIFCAFVYWIFCFSMSVYSKYLEHKLKVKSF